MPVKVPSWQVVHNRGEAQYTAYRHRNRRVALHPGIDNSSISLQDLAFAFEIAPEAHTPCICTHRAHASTVHMRTPCTRMMPAVSYAYARFEILAHCVSCRIALGPMNLRLQLDAGIGIPWYGIFTQQSVTDSATLHQLLWHIQPDLLVEVM